MRTIVVTGVGRSGTSVMAGVCQRLGVDMGEEFVPSDRNNRYGTFEELKFFNINRREIPPTAEDYQIYAKWREDKCQGGVWGVKDPGLVQMELLPVFLSVLDDPRVIIMTRSPKATIASYQRAYGFQYGDAVSWYDNASAAMLRSLESSNVLVAEVDYDDLVNEPESVIEQIIEFVFDGTGISPTAADIENAVAHVKRDERKFDRDGKWVAEPDDKKIGDWGKIAIGVRVSKHPEPFFFNDWTALISSGTRTGDTILRPEIGKPAHWAANGLARSFLRTDKDSLLMVDDDMTFPPDALERLRTNTANQDFDIAFAFCTHKRWPPKPVVMRLRDPQPGEPESLLGHSFTWPERLPPKFLRGGVMEVDAVGLAFTLIRRHVFESMIDREYGPEWTYWFESMTRKKLFRTIYKNPSMELEHSAFFSYGEGKESDDISFCMRAKELGFRMCVDTNVKIGHVGHMVYGWDEYKMWVETKDAQTGDGVHDGDA